MGQDTRLHQIVQRPTASARQVFGAIPLPNHESHPRPLPARSLYLHIPFCFHKCHYCDFYSIVDTRDRQAPFTDRLIREIEALAPWAASAPLRTIFVGGGTPSLLRVGLWERLLKAMESCFDFSLIRGDSDAEFTVECNPETVTPELMEVLQAGGVTRVSMGAQSFDRHHLKTLERWHDPESVPRAIEAARRAGITRQSLDLIYAIPGQSMDQWDADLRAALAQGTEHVSAYALTYEPNTAMTARLKKGEFARADEDLEADMFEHTLSVLRSAGLDRYEVSNFSKPGAECRHNLAYWRQEQWLAAGPSASGHMHGHRWKNVPRLDDYLTFEDSGFAPITDHEQPNPVRALSERLMTGLRISEGIDARAMLGAASMLSINAAQRLQEAVDEQSSRGTIRTDKGRWRLTDAGFLIADRIALALMEAIDPVSTVG